MLNKVKIVGITQPEVYTDRGELLTVEEFLAYVARVSNPDNQMNTLTASKLLSYLATHKHWSPFEMVNIVMEVETPRDIARQILRHRSFAFQEFSQRYADPTTLLGFIHRGARLQDTKNRQNSTELTEDSEHQYIKYQWDAIQDELLAKVSSAYKWAIDHGLAKEVARVILPEGLTNSRMYMNGTLRSWIHYCLLRTANGTQKEHQDVAIKCWELILQRFPSLSTIELQ
jgi:thymidylate synthase (FAD)